MAFTLSGLMFCMVSRSNIKRVIFYSVVKPTINEKGEKEIDVIPPSTALQIGGRAGRYGTKHEEGEVTTFKSNDLPLLRKLLSTPIDPVEVGFLWPIFLSNKVCILLTFSFISF